jgi:hypothetical protein
VLRRLFEASAWGRNGVPPEDWRYRGLTRWVLPLTDVFFLWFGAAGVLAGVGSVEAAASQTWQEYWSLGIAIAALVALIGVIFPKLWLVELLGKIPLIGLVSVYVAIFLIRGTTGEPDVLPTAGLICILILLPIWRIGDLGFVAWRRKRDKEAHTEYQQRNGE